MYLGGPGVFGYMTGDGGIPPGGTATLKVALGTLATRQAYITAYSAGGCAFALAVVEAPAPTTASLILTNLVVSSNTATLTAGGLLANSPYLLEESATMNGWTNATAFWITRTNEQGRQNFSLPVSTNTGARFFRIRSQ